MNRRERRAASKGSKTTLRASATSEPGSLYEAGLNHYRAGRHLAAQLCCQQALEADAGHADSLHLMGLLALQARQYEHAIEWVTRAVRQDPKPGYVASLGTVLQEQGRYEEALQALDKAIQLSPDDADLWRRMGDVLVQLLQHARALLSYRHALKLDPDHADALYKSGALLGQFGRHDEAIFHLDRSDELRPNQPQTLEYRARTLFNLKRFEESVAAGKRAHQLDPGNADTCNNVGAALRLLGRDDEALKWFDKALDIRPNSTELLNNKILSLYDLHRFDDVFALHARMKSLQLNNAMTEVNVSLAHLLTGNLEAGWPGYEARLDLPSANYPKISVPMWRGEEDLDGKTILVAADEGLGDTLQFVRYVPMLARQGARVILVVQDPLYDLLSGMEGVSHCLPKSALTTLPPFEFHCPVSSLPFAFATRLDTIPSETPYLPSVQSRVQAWEDRLGPRTKLRVGLVWSGSPTQTNDHNRSVPLQTFSRILDNDASFVSLQKDPRPNDAAFLRERSDIIDLTAGLANFAETAALASCLDLIITVDTSVAHLAGALGCPTWVLLPYTPPYRWLLDRDDSPWYPSVRLFRQTETRKYESVLDRVQNELADLISVRRHSG